MRGMNKKEKNSFGCEISQQQNGQVVAIFNMSLKDCVLGWASAAGVPELSESWNQELRALGIGNMQTLQLVARGNRWENFLGKIKCDVLVELLKIWKKDQSKK
jgi:hypothetical protein